MAGKKFRRKPNKKSRRRRAPRTKAISLYKTPRGFPDSQIVKHRYIQYLTLDSDGLTIARNLFRANSIYDPDYTGSGGQPMNRDLYASLYDHYVVLGSKITVTAYSGTSLSVGAPAVLYCDLLDTNTSTATTYIEAMERKRSRWSVIPTREFHQGNTFRNYFSCKKFFGLSDVDDNRAIVGAARESNPTEQAFYDVGVFPMDGSTNIDATNVLVTIDYIVKWSEPVPQTRS